MAVATVEEEGEHAAMFFLRQPDGSAEPSAGFAAVACLEEHRDGQVTRWISGAQTSRMRPVLYAYNDDGSDDASRDTAAEIFESIVVGSC